MQQRFYQSTVMSDDFSKKRDYLHEYLSYLQVEKGLAKNSLESYERDLQRLKIWAEKNDFDLLKLTRRDLREWLIDLAGENSRKIPSGGWSAHFADFINF